MSEARTRVLDTLADTICTVERGHPVRVGIDGVDGAGKTTLANELVPIVEARGRPAIRAGIDGFHNPRAVRYGRGPDSPDGYYRDSFNHDALVDRLLAPLGPGGSRTYVPAAFDYRRDAPVEQPASIAPENAVLLFDGVFLHRRELLPHWDLTIFLDVPFSVTVGRAIVRAGVADPDAEALRGRYERRYVAGQELYIADAHPHDAAHIVVDHADVARPHIVRGPHLKSDGPVFRLRLRLRRTRKDRPPPKGFSAT